MGFAAIEDDAAVIHRALDPLTWRGFGVSVLNASPGDLPLLAIDQSAVRLSAIKHAEEDDRVLIRLVGPAAGPPLTTTLHIGLRVEEAHWSDLDERHGESLPVTATTEGTQITLEVPARDVVTIALQLASLH